MRKFLLLLILVFFGLNACWVPKKKRANYLSELPQNIPQKIIQDSTISRVMISQNELDTSKLTLHYQYFLKADSIYKDSVNQAIGHFVFLSSNFEDVENNDIKLSNQFFVSCLDSFHKQALQDYAETEYSSLWEYDVNCEIVDQNAKFITLSNYIFTFTGGAHGNAFQQYLNISKFAGITLKLENFISNTQEFNAIAEKEFRKVLELGEENLENLGFWFENNKFACNNNFTIDATGFNFLFNAYEIGPYSMGQSQFLVPFSAVKHLLKEN